MLCRIASQAYSTTFPYWKPDDKGSNNNNNTSNKTFVVCQQRYQLSSIRTPFTFSSSLLSCDFFCLPFHQDPQPGHHHRRRLCCCYFSNIYLPFHLHIISVVHLDTDHHTSDCHQGQRREDTSRQTDSTRRRWSGSRSRRGCHSG